ncbi:hypothetical protein SLA2020_456730 [Shorea laevis]
MIVKLDLEKAYDCIEWSFVRKALISFNFPPTLIAIIMSCISFAELSIVINGGITESFQPSRGLRQGDPLSPYLFMLCVEFLSIKLQVDQSARRWKGAKLGKSSPILTHLFFADGLIFIGKATTANASYLDHFLSFFYQRFGQKINSTKSKIFFSQNVQVNTKSEICRKLQFSKTSSFDKYLGFPITGKRLSKSDCKFIVDKVRNKLIGWKANMLSLAGKTTLVSYVLSAIPNYYMQGAYLPDFIHNELDKISKQFIWGSTIGNRKAHLVSWEKITQPKKLGGLNLRSSKEANQASMAKALWRLVTEKDSF